MLIEFSVGNYRSFKDVVTFSMVAARISSRNKTLDENNVFHVDQDLALLKSAAIYGANASGKSNLISAIRFMQKFVLSSSRETQVTDKIAVEPFRLSDEVDHKPSFFEIVFLINNRKYRYGFEVTSQEVTSEWLYYVPTIREARLFERKLNDIHIASSFKEGRGLTSRTRSNALFLSVTAQFDGSISKAILRWFNNVNVSLGLDDIPARLHTLTRFEDSENQREIIQFVKKLDLGIDDIQIEKTRYSAPSLSEDSPQELRQLFDILEKMEAEQTLIKTYHKKYSFDGRSISEETFNLETHESEGTKKLFALAYPVLHSLRNGRLLVVDELDARLHPIITCELIKLFNSNVTNPRNAQLIFTTHDTNLLSNRLFRRDQIWFVEKSRYGFSHLYSLVEYKIRDDNTKVRNDASFEKEYIEGRYGAIPFIGDFTSLIDTDNEQETESTAN
jgi:uncharacterized protein